MVQMMVMLSTRTSGWSTLEERRIGRALGSYLGSILPFLVLWSTSALTAGIVKISVSVLVFKILPSRMAPASFVVRHAFESHF